MNGQRNKDSSFKKILIILLTIIFICCAILFAKIKITEHIENEKQKEISRALDNIRLEPNEEDSDEVDASQMTERMLKLKKLKTENKDIVGWIEIEGTNINYPVLQGRNNEYYLTHDYKREYISTGSIFLDKDYDFSLPSSNFLIYGHRNKVGLMFDELIKYESESFYKDHKIIRFTTTKEDAEYEVISAFYSKVYYKDERNVFKYYNFINANNKNEYDDFISNVKKISLYNTGITAQYGEQLMTLSTCDYSVENGRFAVVAKKINVEAH